jgi:hypothetical protein
VCAVPASVLTVKNCCWFVPISAALHFLVTSMASVANGHRSKRARDESEDDDAGDEDLMTSPPTAKKSKNVENGSQKYAL